MMNEYLVMLCDYGLDDAVATCALLEKYRDFQKIDILAVGGNFPADVSLRNLHTLASIMPHDERLTLVDCTGVPQPSVSIPDIHGNDGMGDVFPQNCDATRTLLFEDWLKTYEGCNILLSLGPMTVTELILKKALPDRFIFMAGCVNAEPNYNGYEFNVGLNPAAFAECVKYPHKAVLLDTGCENLDISHLEIPLNTPYNILANACKMLSAKRGEKKCFIWDDIAVRYLFHPQSFTEKMQYDKNGNLINALTYIGDPITFG